MEKRNAFASSLCISLFLMGFFSTLYIVRVASFQLSTIMAAVTLILIILVKGKIRVFATNHFFVFFMLIVALTSVLNLFFSLRDTYNIRVSIRAFLEYAILLICAEQMVNLGNKELMFFVKGLRLSCVFHLAWTIAQFIAYHGIKADINEIILSGFFHLSNGEYGASRYENGELVLSGLCWHPVNLAPTLALTVLLFDKWYIWGIALFIAFYSQNGTTMIVLLLLLMVRLYLLLSEKQIGSKIKNWLKQSKKLLFLPIFVTIFILVVVNLYPLIREAVLELSTRVNTQSDNSTQAHLRYYISYPQVVKIISLPEILFGCGIGRSGVYMSSIFHQYTSIAYWSVESDPMNMIYSTGVLGFVSYYLWLFTMIIKGLKTDRKNSAFLFVIIIGGIFYGIQFPWLIQIELIIGVMLKYHRSLFIQDYNSKKGGLYTLK